MGKPSVRRPWPWLDVTMLGAALALAVASGLAWEINWTIAGPVPSSGLHRGGAVTLPLAVLAAALSFVTTRTGRLVGAALVAIPAAAASLIAWDDRSRLMTRPEVVVIDNSYGPASGVTLAVLTGAALTCLALAAGVRLLRR
jgi:hypothetical protein